MNFGQTLKISVNAIRLNKVRASLTILGVVIGVASVILLVSLVSGLGKTIRQEFEGFGANLLVVFPGDQGGGRGPGGAVANKMEFEFEDLLKNKVPELKYVVPSVQGVGTIKYKNKDISGTIIYGVTGDYFEAVNIAIETGRAFRLNENSNVAIVGETVVEELFPNVSALGKDILVKDRRYKIVGIQEARGSIFGQDQDNIVILPLGPARSLLGLDRPNWFFIKVDENYNVNTAKEHVEEVLLRELDEDDFTVSTQEETLELVGNILGVLSAGLGGVAAISLLVGGIGIMNIMLVSVTERTREIGLRKAIGATRRDILLQFLVEATMLSLLGGVVGVVVGSSLSLVINQFITTEINAWYTLLAFSFSAVVGIVFGIAPAIKASKLSPIEALRYE